MAKFFQNDVEITSLESLKFPITEKGTSSDVSFVIENTLVADPVELIFWSDDGDMTAEHPTIKLNPLESTNAKVTFSPPKDRPDSLKTKWGYREIIG